MSDYSQKIFAFISTFLRNSAGVEVGTLANPLRVDPTNTTPQQITGTISVGTVTIGTIAAGSNIIGKVGIDQTTPGTTNRVDIGNIPHVIVDAAPASAVDVTDRVGRLVGHVTVDTAPTTAVTNAGLSNLDVALSTRTKPADQQHAIIDSGTLTAVTAITNALPAGSNVIGHVIADTGSTTAVTGNVTVVQPTGTSLHAVLDTTSTTAVTQATGTNLHTVVDSGTITTVTTLTGITNSLPVGANVIGKVSIDQTTPGTTNLVQVGGSLPAGSAVIGHVITDTGSTTAVTGTVTVAGTLSHNNAAPSTNNIGVLPALANASTPSFTEGDLTLLSVTTSGFLRSQAVGSKTNNTVAPGATNMGVLPSLANAAAPTFTEGNQVSLSSDLSGNLRVAGTVNLTQIGSASIALGQQVASASLPVSISSDVVDVFQQMLGEMRVMRAAIVKMACEDGRALPEDFNQAHGTAESENDQFIN